ncbi:MAG: hypothetical protein HY825_16700 [Acidobacteria bacterium]|nr:hypothetical protein [Acidobacteriota bacterium]
MFHAAGAAGARPRCLSAGLLAAMLLALPALADEPAGPPVVALVVGGGADPVVDVLASAVQAQVGDLPVRLVVERPAELPATMPQQVALAAEVAVRVGAASVFWFDVSLPNRVFVYFAERSGSRVLMRAVGAGGEAERVESAAVIVRGLVQAMLAGGTIGMELPPGPPAVPPVEVPPPVGTSPAVEPRWLGLQLGYAVDFFSARPNVLHGLDAGLAFRLHANWSLFAAYRVLSDAEVSGGGLELRVTRHPFVFGVRFGWPIDDWEAGASLYGVADDLTREANAHAAGVTVTSDEGAWLGGLGLLVHGSYRVAGALGLFLEGGVEVYLNQVDFVVDTGDGRELLLGSRSFCPRLLLGLRVDLL